MVKNDALKLSINYLQKVKQAKIELFEAWLFGSFARGNQNENSDIDIAIILNEHGAHSFDTEVMLMLLRQGEETIIEPHAFTLDEFDSKDPIVNQIIQYGQRIEV